MRRLIQQSPLHQHQIPCSQMWLKQMEKFITLTIFIRMMKHQQVQVTIPFQFLQSVMLDVVEIQLLMDSSHIVFARNMVTPTQY